MLYCRNDDERLNSLRRCGCRRCEEEYYNMRSNYERYVPSYSNKNYYLPIATTSAVLPAKISKESKMEEPKNIAIKILVDKLKTEQGNLASNEAQLKIYEGHAKTYRENKNKNQKDIKELAAALKKLGHKNDA